MNSPRCLIPDTSRTRNSPVAPTYSTESGTCVVYSPISGSWEKRSTSGLFLPGGNASAAEESSAALTIKCTRTWPGRRSGSVSTASRSMPRLSGDPCPGSTNWRIHCDCAAPEKATGRHHQGAPHGTRLSQRKPANIFGQVHNSAESAPRGASMRDLSRPGCRGVLRLK